MFSKATISLILPLILLIAGCGGDEGGVTTTGAPPSDGGGATSTTADPAGTKGGTITVDGTTYVVEASLQCLISPDTNQYYVSGILPELASGEPYDLDYRLDEDGDDLSVDIGDVGYTSYFTDDVDSTISGRVITGTATLTADDGSGDVPVEFRFEC